MYETYFGFTKSPFELSPDPYFLFQTPVHREGFACVYYAVTRRKGFVVLTGEVGTGKTLLTRMLLQAMMKTNIASAYVFNPRLTRDDFLRYILDELGITIRSSKSEMLHDLNRFLIDRHRSGLTTALIVDEAHLLDLDVLEEIRLLTNLETSTQKLLQIILVGQPELGTLLDSPKLRQLKQRVAIRWNLLPLDATQTQAYIRFRVQRAGAKVQPEALFPNETLELIERYSGGIPRLINNICENALISAFARQQKTVTPNLIEEVASDLRLNANHISATAMMSESAATQ
jgi:general secretion pathway protein A